MHTVAFTRWTDILLFGKSISYIPSIRKDNGVWPRDNKHQAGLFAEYFSETFTTNQMQEECAYNKK